MSSSAGINPTPAPRRMRKIVEVCEACKEISPEKKNTAIEDSRESVDVGGGKVLNVIKLQCGHSIIEEVMAGVGTDSEGNTNSSEDIYFDARSKISLDTETGLPKIPRYYQVKTANFIEQANYRAGIFHDTGVGKTLCAMLPVLAHREILLPLAVFCKAGLTRQWQFELKDWLGLESQVIQNGKHAPCYKEGPDDEFGYDAFIVSYDSFKRTSWIEDFRVNYIILDECQAIKAIESKRTKAIQDAVRDKQNVVGLSATPFKNSAREYYPVLNLLEPKLFYSEQAYLERYVNYYFDASAGVMKYGGLVNPERFKERTKHFIIRYTREEVAPELPKINRQFTYMDVEDELIQAFEKAYDEFDSIWNESEEHNIGKNKELQASLFKLWHLTGISKVNSTVEYVKEFLENEPENKKITLFKHHNDVGDFIKIKLDAWCEKNGYNKPLILNADSPWRDKYVDQCTKTHWPSIDPKDRVLIVSALAGGEGLNLQACGDMVGVERLWNPQNEGQCEGRFSRIGSVSDTIYAQYFCAVGTIDDYFVELNEKKRKWFNEAMSGVGGSGEELERNVMQELTEAIVRRGKKRFKRK